MNITLIETGDKGWVVKLAGCDVPFRSQADAGLFVERLQQRLEAPHELPPLDGHLPVTQEAEHRP
ncbi:hypothetical protein [Pseudomonas subflava]|uniref:hypothetical protein n=1 Tax=Pseudomonas subflava TaxID=2952933 RepID=UPI00207B06C5|nr:hypothetical protein [Pseudomonas subflava]HSX69769.1 hypothetical protein [Pseudomonas sp.]